MRLWIVASSPFACARLGSMVASRTVSVVGSSADLESLVRQVLDVEPDAVVLDASGENATALLDELLACGLPAEIPTVVLRDAPRAEWTADALRGGVRGILPADTPANQLLAALQAAIAGLLVAHPSDLPVAQAASNSGSAPLAELPEQLTPREREVLQRLAAGLANKQIADQLRISEHTVKFHVASILGKLGASTRTEAVALGIRHGLVLL
jgi:DNA-binding NarL/FixJ family response regulator